MRRWFWSSVFWLIISLSFGVIAREWTRAAGFTGDTALFRVHGHALVLGCLCSLLILILLTVFKLSLSRAFFWLFQISLILVISAMVIRGALDISATELIGLNYFAGLGHIALSVSFGWFFVRLYQALRPYESFHQK